MSRRSVSNINGNMSFQDADDEIMDDIDTISDSSLDERDESENLTNKTLLLINEHLKRSMREDSLNVYGKYVVSCLRKMTKEQRLFAERIINDVLFRAALSNLSFADVERLDGNSTSKLGDASMEKQ
ncbi:uncharacterized protein LOC113368103 [Ctenocephalides felis]|uniref:uncharacterized protein LOC113368103 n=1 Tax=Ctenocephalides felis TaxID=7515 RepID=UPI000E6E16A9|nr:uncharacterized protein LOC113368103 [Ctenocephalides felis]